jgi:hypothetical protein
MEKSGKELMSELAHTMTFLESMGFDTTKISVADAVQIKNDLINSASEFLGEPTEKAKNAF